MHKLTPTAIPTTSYMTTNWLTWTTEAAKTVLLKLVNDLLWAMKRKNVPALVALDLSAAFNTVDHELSYPH